jgi:hypothetical protein
MLKQADGAKKEHTREERTIRVDLGCGLGKLPGNTTIYPQRYPLWDIAFAPVFDYSSS